MHMMYKTMHRVIVHDSMKVYDTLFLVANSDCHPSLTNHNHPAAYFDPPMHQDRSHYIDITWQPLNITTIKLLGFQ